MLTPLQRSLRKSYTKAGWCGQDQATGEKLFAVRLVIGCQSFTIARDETKSDAAWYRNQLAIALSHLKI